MTLSLLENIKISDKSVWTQRFKCQKYELLKHCIRKHQFLFVV